MQVYEGSLLAFLPHSLRMRLFFLVLNQEHLDFAPLTQKVGT